MLKFRLPLLIATLLTTLSGCGGEADSAQTSSPPKPHDHSSHQHLAIEASDYSEQIPTVKLVVEADTMSGWNLQLQTENFRFAPEQVNRDASANEGHAHVFVDGYKFHRVYSHWLHLKKLTPGEHVIRVTLNANDHSEWSHNGEVIAASATIIQQ